MTSEDKLNRLLQAENTLTPFPLSKLSIENESDLKFFTISLSAWLHHDEELGLLLAYTAFIDAGYYPPTYILLLIKEILMEAFNNNKSLDQGFGIKGEASGKATKTKKRINELFVNVKLTKMYHLILDYELTIEIAAELVSNSRTNEIGKKHKTETLIDYYHRNKPLMDAQSKLRLELLEADTYTPTSLNEFPQHLLKKYQLL